MLTPAPAPYRFASEQSIRWVDVDVAGVVNHAVWFTLVEQARFEYFSRFAVAGDAPPFLLGETSARYLRPGRMGMKVVVLARTTRLGGKSFDMEYEIRDAADAAAPDEQMLVTDHERTLVTIRARLVWVDAQLRSCEIPPSVRRAVAEFEGIPERA